jgi:hypothetical protein
MNWTLSYTGEETRNYTNVVQTAQKVTASYRALGPVANMSQRSFQSAGVPGDISYLQMGPTLEMYASIYDHWTFECWMRKGTDTDTAGTALGVVGANGGNGLMSSYTYSTNFLNFTFEPPNNSRTYEVNHTVQSDANINTSWFHWALVGTDTWLSLVINGSNVSHVDYLETLGVNESIFSTGNGIQYLGIDNIRLNNDWLYNNCRIWNVSRPSENVSALMFQEITEADAPPTNTSLDQTNLSITVYDEETDQPITGVPLTAWVFNHNVSYNITIDTSNASLTLNNLPNGIYQFRITESYNYTNYWPRTRWIEFNDTNQTINERFYLINKSFSTGPTLVRVTDETGIPLINVSVVAFRRFVSHGYLPIQEGITDTNGYTSFYFHLHDIPYKFEIRANKTLIGSAEAAVISQSPVNLAPPQLPDPLESYRRAGNYTRGFSNDSNETLNISFLFADIKGQMISQNMHVAYMEPNGPVTMCNQSMSAPYEGSLNCTVDNVSGREYYAQGCVYFDANMTGDCITTGWINGTTSNTGQLGLFLFLLIFISFTGALMWSATGLTLGIAVSLIMGAFMGLFSVLWGVLSVFVVLAIVHQATTRT